MGTTWPQSYPQVKASPISTPALKYETMTKQQIRILALLSLAMFLVVLDSAIINVALPAIKAALHVQDASLQWVLTAYILTFGGFLLLGGRTADLYGRRRILVVGVAGFAICSLLIGLSPSGPILIALRAAQGLAGAFMAPTALSILLTTFPEGHTRNQALSAWSVVAAGAAAVGVFLGGLLTQYLGWRWCFFVNVPIGLLAIPAILKYIPAHSQEARDKHLDLPGAILVTSGLMTLVYALTSASSSGWTSPLTLSTLGASLALLAGFILNEAKASHPLMPLSIFRLRNVIGGNLVMLPIIAGALGMFFFVSLYIQGVLHYSPSATGVAFLPLPIIIGLISIKAPALLRRFKVKTLVITGTALTSLGTIGLSLLNAHSSYLGHLLPAFLVLAAGFGISFVAITVAATTGIPANEAGLASGLINTSQQIGGALGLAVLTVIAQTTTASRLAAGYTIADATVAGYQRAFLTAVILMLAALAVAITVIRTPQAPKTSS